MHGFKLLDHSQNAAAETLVFDDECADKLVISAISARNRETLTLKPASVPRIKRDEDIIGRAKKVRFRYVLGPTNNRENGP